MQHETEYEIPVCAVCGKPLDHGARFCGSCGAALPSVPTDFPEGSGWKDQTLGICPSCLNPIPFDRNCCILCGKELHGPEKRFEQIEQYRAKVKRYYDRKKNPGAPAVCQNCDAPLDDGASFCGSCGAYIYPIDDSLSYSDAWKEQPLDVCPMCAQIVPADREYCIFCGSPLHISKEDYKALRADKAQHLDCSISFCIKDLTEHQIELFYLYLHRNRTHADPFIAECDHTVDCEFSLTYSEPGNGFTKGVAANMIRLFLEDAAKAFPKLQATAYCHYGPTYIAKSKLCPFDDLGGFVSFTLSDGEVTVDDTPYV